MNSRALRLNKGKEKKSPDTGGTRTLQPQVGSMSLNHVTPQLLQYLLVCMDTLCISSHRKKYQFVVVCTRSPIDIMWRNIDGTRWGFTFHTPLLCVDWWCCVQGCLWHQLHSFGLTSFLPVVLTVATALSDRIRERYICNFVVWVGGWIYPECVSLRRQKWR